MEVVGVKFRVRPKHQDININKFGHIVLLKLDCMSLDLARDSSLLSYFWCLSLCTKREKELHQHWDSHHFTLFLSPPTWSLLMTQTCVYSEREGPWARDSTFTKVSLCLHHLSSPPGPHSHSRTQQRNLARTWDSCQPVTRSVFKEIREFRFMNHKRSLRCVNAILIQNMFSVLPRWFSASSHDNLIINYKLHWKNEIA